MIGRENMNQIWASLLVEECVRNGADTFFLAPGARCAPLTVAVSQHPDARIVQHFDERGLGFAALGFARATGRPGVLITTSGTAVSNLTPAVVEASMDAQPMLLLTADRPFELRDCGANQSIPQVQAFAPYVVDGHDLPAPNGAIPPQSVLTLLDKLLHQSAKGPVHLNCPFREPLAPVSDRTDAETYLLPIHEWMNHREPYTQIPPLVCTVDEMVMVDLKEELSTSAKVLVIAGGGCTEAEAMAIVQLAEQQQWPILSDVTSGLHFGPDQQQVIQHAETLLGPSGFPLDLKPDHVVQFGTRFLSKALLQALETMPPKTWTVVSPREGRFDPIHRVTHRIRSDIDRFCLAWHQEGLVETPEGWCAGWREADDKVEQVFQQQLDDAHSLTEPGVARAITRLLPHLNGLVVGASMPIRDVSSFAYPSERRIHVAANRGASGIDGTLATAFGFARGLSQTTTVFLGDLSTLHDLNSLALVAQSRIPLIVVVVNNHGGGIFHFLPLAETAPNFEKFFGTPHALQFGSAADMFHLPYAKVTDLPAFVETYEEALREKQSCIIEVETDRERNVEQHRALAAMLDLKV